jgi:histidine triad (HIT) family protein
VNQASCLFCRIARGEIPAKVAHQDDELIAFHDIDPKSPVHVLIIPRKHIGSIAQLENEDAELIGRLFSTARDLAVRLGVSESGYRMVINAGPDAGQSVDHIHLHLLGGRRLKWPPG